MRSIRFRDGSFVCLALVALCAACDGRRSGSPREPAARPRGTTASALSADGRNTERDASRRDARTNLDGASRVVRRRAVAAPLFAAQIERGFVADAVEPDDNEWIDEGDPARVVRRSPTLIERYVDRRRGALIEVHAIDSERDEPRADAARWARALFSRWAPSADLSDRSLERGWDFRVSERADHNRRAEARLFQVPWSSALDDDLHDVLVAAAERGAVTYIVFVVLPAGAAHWDRLDEVPDRRTILPRDLQLGRQTYARYIASL